MRALNDTSLALLKQLEGFVPYAYDDFDPPSRRRRIKAGDKIHGTLTIGYGHTGPDVKPGMTVSQQFGDELLRKDLAETLAAVNAAVKVPLTDNQFGALVLFAFNIGADDFKTSTLLKRLNAGKYDAVPGQLARWVKSKGKTMQGLVNRRAAEAGLWAKGEFVQSSGSAVDPKTDAAISPELVTVGTAIATGAGSSLVTGNGPVQWALAALAVAAIGAAILLYVRKRLRA